MSKRVKRYPVDRPHPLEPIAREVFKVRPVLDRVILAEGLKGDPFTSTSLKPNPKGPKLGMSGNRAYLVVAEDVLGYMACQGKIVADSMGWWRLDQKTVETHSETKP
jgi:hypothetical protein